MWLNQNKNQESEVCDNIINHTANEAVKVLENICRLSWGAREEAEAKSDPQPSPLTSTPEEQHILNVNVKLPQGRSWRLMLKANAKG